MHRFVMILALALLVGMPALAQSQQTDEDLMIEQAHIRATQPSGDAAADAVFDRLLHAQGNPLAPRLMMGLGPDANLSLVSQHGDANAARVAQEGTANVAVMLQLGYGNTSFLEQIGHGNSIAASVEGDYNRLSVSQRGDDNRYVLDFRGDDLDHTVTQHGSGMNAVQIGVGRKPFSIEQRGRGTSVTVEHNP